MQTKLKTDVRRPTTSEKDHLHVHTRLSEGVSRYAERGTAEHELGIFPRDNSVFAVLQEHRFRGRYFSSVHG